MHASLTRHPAVRGFGAGRSGHKYHPGPKPRLSYHRGTRRLPHRRIESVYRSERFRRLRRDASRDM
jgi:hypothetical protein